MRCIIGVLTQVDCEISALLVLFESKLNGGVGEVVELGTLSELLSQG